MIVPMPSGMMIVYKSNIIMVGNDISIVHEDTIKYNMHRPISFEYFKLGDGNVTNMYFKVTFVP